mmetsp:Transcript_11330/g.25358  ORF Transcript_11330/g.25358 Transcript_11330/m.25358 type:complete len:224 (+) Transcript_11330:192-863(+)
MQGILDPDKAILVRDLGKNTSKGRQAPQGCHTARIQVHEEGASTPQRLLDLREQWRMAGRDGRLQAPWLLEKADSRNNEVVLILCHLSTTGADVRHLPSVLCTGLLELLCRPRNCGVSRVQQNEAVDPPDRQRTTEQFGAVGTQCRGGKLRQSDELQDQFLFACRPREHSRRLRSWIAAGAEEEHGPMSLRLVLRRKCRKNLSRHIWELVQGGQLYCAKLEDL